MIVFIQSVFLTVPPITIPALIRIRFLMMYCPSNVRPNGTWVKQISGNSISGKNVPGTWRNRRKIAPRMTGLKSRQTPMDTSHQPRMGIKISGSNQ